MGRCGCWWGSSCFKPDLKNIQKLAKYSLKNVCSCYRCFFLFSFTRWVFCDCSLGTPTRTTLEQAKEDVKVFNIELTNRQVLQRKHTSIFDGEQIGKKLPELNIKDERNVHRRFLLSRLKNFLFTAFSFVLLQVTQCPRIFQRQHETLWGYEKEALYTFVQLSFKMSGYDYLKENELRKISTWKEYEKRIESFLKFYDENKEKYVFSSLTFHSSFQSHSEFFFFSWITRVKMNKNQKFLSDETIHHLMSLYEKGVVLHFSFHFFSKTVKFQSFLIQLIW